MCKDTIYLEIILFCPCLFVPLPGHILCSSRWNVRSTMLEYTFHDAGIYIPRCWNVEFSLTNAGNYRGFCMKWLECLTEKPDSF